MDLDPAEIRRRNFIPADKFPFETSAGLLYDSGNYEPALARALEMVGYDDLRAEQSARRARGDGKYLGIGISSYVEMCGLAPSRLLGQLNFGARRLGARHRARSSRPAWWKWSPGPVRTVRGTRRAGR